MPTLDWVRLQDSKGRTYYYNTRNSSSQWEAPHDFREPTPRTVKSVQAKGVIAPDEMSKQAAVAPFAAISSESLKRSFRQDGPPAAAANAAKPTTSLMGKAQSLLNKAKISSKLGLPTQLSRSTPSSPAAAAQKHEDPQHFVEDYVGDDDDDDEEEELLDDRRCWGRPDRLRTESGEDAFWQDPNLRFRTSSSADLHQLIGLTKSISLAKQQPPILPRVDSMKRPPSFMELDLKNGKIAPNLVRPVKMSNNTNRMQTINLAAAAAATTDNVPVATQKPAKSTTRPRRNTTNSIHMDNLMSKPDSGTMIRCVASLLHAQMVRFALASNGGARPPNLKRFQVFNEDFGKEDSVANTAPDGGPQLKRVASSASNTATSLERQLLTKTMSSHKLHVLSEAGPSLQGPKLPDKDTIAAFIDMIFQKAQMESETIIMLLIYVERLLEATRGKLELQMRNWKPIVMSCMILASKVWDDLSMWNADFSLISGSFTTKRINELEVALLEAMQYNVRVPASTYAKYYFQLRALRAELGELKRGSNEPLSIESAARLEMLTDRYQDALGVGWVGPGKDKKLLSSAVKQSDTTPTKTGVRLRSNTLHEGANRAVIESMHTAGPRFTPDKQHKIGASLEQVVSANPMGPQSDAF